MEPGSAERPDRLPQWAVTGAGHELPGLRGDVAKGPMVRKCMAFFGDSLELSTVMECWGHIRVL